MARKIHSPTLAETAFGLRTHNPVTRLMTGFTGFVVVMTLILATTIPVEAHRSVCAISLEAPTSSCTSD